MDVGISSMEYLLTLLKNIRKISMVTHKETEDEVRQSYRMQTK